MESRYPLQKAYYQAPRKNKKFRWESTVRLVEVRLRGKVRLIFEAKIFGDQTANQIATLENCSLDLFLLYLFHNGAGCNSSDEFIN